MGRFGEWLCDNLPVVAMVLVAMLIAALVVYTSEDQPPAARAPAEPRCCGFEPTPR